jgi:hypothetical protein
MGKKSPREFPFGTSQEYSSLTRLPEVRSSAASGGSCAGDARDLGLRDGGSDRALKAVARYLHLLQGNKG